MKYLTTARWLLLASTLRPTSAQLQIPLTAAHDSSTVAFNVREQTPELCDAGSKYFTGVLNITSEKSMFFWYFESRHSPDTDPLVLWLSGGPGATGELGCFVGSGPCAVNEDGNSTRRLEYSWVDNANPIGVGFSQITNRSSIVVNLRKGARDIYRFLTSLSTDVFPHLAGRPWHIAGESMGGHYATGYTEYIARRERENAALGIQPRINISSVVIVDGYIDATRHVAGYYDFFCTNWRRDRRHEPLMNDSACASMAAGVPACEAMGMHCRQGYDPKVCRAAMEVCNGTVGRFFDEGVQPGGWDPYDDRHACETPPLCSNLAHGATWQFFNQRWVQNRLGFGNYPFELIDFDTNNRWVAAEYVNLPVTRELSWILDSTDIRVLVINGNNDIIINTPGQMRMLDELPWKEQAVYRSLGYENWYFKDGELTSGHDGAGYGVRQGGFWKGTARLAFYAVDEAGHFSPSHQPEAIGAVLRSWLRK
ncbi:hypothetical protein ASPVEDRAFT_83474 [Aspergillus versicolor CBS 583.65]|uniref:Carboxypeptidase n=1 Tax=Aspergillus versicolor CBS 583.65 TaxID=1036611 RepID=A0A1L9PKE7_ASPVE|nr:uncharacterized protein ASPVEDRAFT_83474 [Aspergillus versicolor CBS 583.65]OJJ01953.1 hypothetical protein ASPVEDRAFT_83474 [Aspergillus versicolor CBS 583.65]